MSQELISKEINLMLNLIRMLALEEVYDVTIVKDGQEAYDTVKSNMEKGEVFDLIFMDIQVSSLRRCVSS